MNRVSKMMTAAAIALAAAAGGYGLLGSRGSDAKTLVGRLWIERIPRDDTDQIELMVMLADEPIGIFRRTSQFEGSYALFRYELRGDDKLQLLFPQNKSKHEVAFDARPCDAKGFDYCLDLSGAPRGAAKYYSRKDWEIDASDPAALEGALRELVDELRASPPEP
ncbi:hypothetical protein BE04_16715 [Sorangium cellulosum]|uniref:Uncharacterized protein n=2 Tax=Sorangium cellulosum TaxID=56 RepID=A0A150P0D5_SORCE|nr:hypothetical protein [Sorangium cellulosum]AGP33901.1 hypothetical protein SCE1572_04970 [Sorangium cellulosum So0157-2]KYF47868.1 hypothetical protein BE04_16715 [Sorangium cellulosum]